MILLFQGFIRCLHPSFAHKRVYYKTPQAHSLLKAVNMINMFFLSLYYVKNNVVRLYLCMLNNLFKKNVIF